MLAQVSIKCFHLNCTYLTATTHDCVHLYNEFEWDSGDKNAMTTDKEMPMSDPDHKYRFT